MSPPPNRHSQDTTPPFVSCAACRAQLPLERALPGEAQDYVLYFCGMGCYAAWQRTYPDRPQRRQERQP